MNIYLDVFLLILGFVLVFQSANKFILYAESLGNFFGLSNLLIGVVIVGLATSMPEILVSIISALQGNPFLGFGNAIGSNIANISLVIAVVMLISNNYSKLKIEKNNFLVLIIISVFFFLLIFDGNFDRYDSIISLTLLLLSFFVLIKSNKKESNNKNESNFFKVFSYFLISYIFLIISSKIIVHFGVNIAEKLNLSDLTVGAVIFAFGTSLPELSASIVSIMNKKYNIAIGNILGSNLLNLLLGVGLIGFVTNINIPQFVLNFDYSIMLTLTLSMVLFTKNKAFSPGVYKLTGILFLLLYVYYIISVIMR